MATIDRDGRCVDPLDGLVSGPASLQDPVAIGGDGVLLYPRPVIPRRPLLLVCVLLLLTGCGGRAGTDDPLQSALEATPPATLAIPSRLPSVPVVPETDKPVGGDVTQTDTEWGRIWDALPASFPVYPGAVETEEAGAGEPVSATFTAAAAPDEIATWMQSQLELATYSTEALSGPLEDGRFVLDSVGEEGCGIETTVAPAGGLTIITVRYGADCPFE
jgi:hypothetical protein